MEPLEVIEYDSLSNSTIEAAKLMAACETQGFFYLHLPQERYQSLWSDVDHSFSTMKLFFDQTLSEKLKVHLKYFGESEIAGYVIPNTGAVLFMPELIVVTGTNQWDTLQGCSKAGGMGGSNSRQVFLYGQISFLGFEVFLTIRWLTI